MTCEMWPAPVRSPASSGMTNSPMPTAQLQIRPEHPALVEPRGEEPWPLLGLVLSLAWYEQSWGEVWSEK